MGQQDATIGQRQSIAQGKQATRQGVYPFGSVGGWVQAVESLAGVEPKLIRGRDHLPIHRHVPLL